MARRNVDPAPALYAVSEPGERHLDLFVAHEGSRVEAFVTLNEALRAGLAAQMEVTGRSLKGQLRHAERLGASYVAIVGEDGHATLRDMSSGEQEEIPTDGVVVAIKQGRA